MYVCFELSKSASVDVVWGALSEAGLELILSSEDPDGTKEIYGYIPAEEAIASILSKFPDIIAIKPAQEEPVDWESQWAEHGQDFRGGFVHLDLSEYISGVDRVLRLEPGAGFGDLSHPTTRLTLRLMAPHVKGSFVIDVGCGSGVLSVAAAGLGAKAVHGIDIDGEALNHARHNAGLNGMSNEMTFGLPEEPFVIPEKTPVLIAMNMIQSEQEMAWGALKVLHGLKAKLVTSGILAEAEEEYMAWGRSQGWKLVEKLEEDGWSAFLWD